MEKCPESMIFMLGGNKMNAKDILKKALTDMGADGLWNGSLGEEACGCGIDDLDPCDCCNVNYHALKDVACDYAKSRVAIGRLTQG
jgi:hypothetical protein